MDYKNAQLALTTLENLKSLESRLELLSKFKNLKTVELYGSTGPGAITKVVIYSSQHPKETQEHLIEHFKEFLEYRINELKTILKAL